MFRIHQTNKGNASAFVPGGRGSYTLGILSGGNNDKVFRVLCCVECLPT